MKSPLKWVGGKTKLLEEINKNIPKFCNNYYELCLGGGTVLLNILENKNIKIQENFYAFDVNIQLINFFNNIKNNWKELNDLIKELVELYNNYSKEEQEKYYYYIRKQYNILKKNKNNNIKISSYFWFLNKTGFRGLYRENKTGGYNVPFGNYSKISIYEDLEKLSLLIKNVEFRCLELKESLKLPQKNDFVYIDPPYYKMSFTQYNSDNVWNEQTHLDLFEVLKKTKFAFCLSNCDSQNIKEVFKDYKIIMITTKHTIHSKDASKTVKELFIKNY